MDSDHYKAYVPLSPLVLHPRIRPSPLSCGMQKDTLEHVHNSYAAIAPSLATAAAALGPVLDPQRKPLLHHLQQDWGHGVVRRPDR
jgi:hypothetical protein